MMNRHCYALACLLVMAVLTGCSSVPVTTQTPQAENTAPTSATPGEGMPPAPSALDIGPFIEMARQASCARDQNRLVVIDGEMVLWERRDLGCADASYEIALFGASPDEPLCRINDSIAGPMLSCQDESLQQMFETIVDHTQEADLGLGGDHTVEQAWP
jgi:hypothetical protein